MLVDVPLYLKLCCPLIAAAIVGVDAQAIVVLAIAIVAGLLTLRSQAMKLLREERDLQKHAREQTEAALATAKAELAEALGREEELKRRPDYQQLYGLMEAHIADGDRIVKALEDLTAKLDQQTAAIQLWATARAQELG